MNSRKLFGASALLSIALSIPAIAGEVQTPTAPSPPPTNSFSAPTAPAPENGAAVHELTEAQSTSSDLFVDVLLSMFWLY